MNKIGRLWAGRLFGTNTGNVSADLLGEDDNVVGEVRFLDDRFGAVVYEVTGSFDGTNVALSGKATLAPEGVVNGVVTIKGALTPQGEVGGHWTSSIGTGGTFILYPHDSPAFANQTAPTTAPARRRASTQP